MALFAQLLLLRYNLPKHNRAAESNPYYSESQNISSCNLCAKVGDVYHAQSY